MKLSSTCKKIQSFFQDTNSRVSEEINFISTGTKLRGDFIFENFTRIHGEIKGSIQGLPESLIVIGEEASVEGEIYCDDIMIDGFVKASIKATGKIYISATGTLMGDATSDRFEMEFGAKFEGKTNIQETYRKQRDC